MNAWLDDLGRRLAAAAQQGAGVDIEPPALSGPVATELLELARVAAHTQERRFAPLASYLAGVTMGRLDGAGAAPEPERQAALIRAVRETLEREAGEPTA